MFPVLGVVITSAAMITAILVGALLMAYNKTMSLKTEEKLAKKQQAGVQAAYAAEQKEKKQTESTIRVSAEKTAATLKQQGVDKLIQQALMATSGREHIGRANDAMASWGEPSAQEPPQDPMQILMRDSM